MPIEASFAVCHIIGRNTCLLPDVGPIHNYMNDYDSNMIQLLQISAKSGTDYDH